MLNHHAHVYMYKSDYLIYKGDYAVKITIHTNTLIMCEEDVCIIVVCRVYKNRMCSVMYYGPVTHNKSAAQYKCSIFSRVYNVSNLKSYQIIFKGLSPY